MGLRFLILIATFLVAAAAMAQPQPPTKSSIDELVINSQYSCVCRIVKVFGPYSDNIGANVEVKVEHRIRGEVRDEVGFLIKGSVVQFEEWRAKGTRLLAFNGGEAINLSDPNLSIFDANLHLLHKTDAIVAAARAAVRSHPGVLRIDTYWLHLPVPVARANDMPLDMHVLVPCDAQLERWAIGRLHALNVEERGDAVLILRRFPSDENARLLLQIVGDKSIDAKNEYVKRYAQDALDAWRIKS